MPCFPLQHADIFQDVMRLWEQSLWIWQGVAQLPHWHKSPHSPLEHIKYQKYIHIYTLYIKIIRNAADRIRTDYRCYGFHSNSSSAGISTAEVKGAFLMIFSSMLDIFLLKIHGRSHQCQSTSSVNFRRGRRVWWAVYSCCNVKMQSNVSVNG